MWRRLINWIPIQFVTLITLFCFLTVVVIWFATSPANNGSIVEIDRIVPEAGTSTEYHPSIPTTRQNNEKSIELVRKKIATLLSSLNDQIDDAIPVYSRGGQIIQATQVYA